MDFVANWLVQGCVVALATVVIVRCLPRALAATRYLVCWVGLSAVLTLPLVSLIPGALSQVHGVTVETTAPGALVWLPHSPTLTPLIIGAWLVWVAVFGGQLAPRWSRFNGRGNVAVHSRSPWSAASATGHE